MNHQILLRLRQLLTTGERRVIVQELVGRMGTPEEIAAAIL
jgi:hypothetical protein